MVIPQVAGWLFRKEYRTVRPAWSTLRPLTSCWYIRRSSCWRRSPGSRPQTSTPWRTPLARRCTGRSRTRTVAPGTAAGRLGRSTWRCWTFTRTRCCTLTVRCVASRAASRAVCRSWKFPPRPETSSGWSSRTGPFLRPSSASRTPAETRCSGSRDRSVRSASVVTWSSRWGFGTASLKKVSVTTLSVSILAGRHQRWQSGGQNLQAMVWHCAGDVYRRRPLWHQLPNGLGRKGEGHTSGSIVPHRKLTLIRWVWFSTNFLFLILGLHVLWKEGQRWTRSTRNVINYNFDRKHFRWKYLEQMDDDFQIDNSLIGY